MFCFLQLPFVFSVSFPFWARQTFWYLFYNFLKQSFTQDFMFINIWAVSLFFQLKANCYHLVSLFLLFLLFHPLLAKLLDQQHANKLRAGTLRSVKKWWPSAILLSNPRELYVGQKVQLGIPLSRSNANERRHGFFELLWLQDAWSSS